MIFQCTVVSFEIIYTQTVGYTCILLCIYIHICVTNIIKAKTKATNLRVGNMGVLQGKTPGKSRRSKMGMTQFYFN